MLAPARKNFIEQRNVVPIERPASIEQAAQMTLALTAPVGPNLTAADREEMERRYRAIEMLVEPEKYRLLYSMYPTQALLIDWLSGQHKVPARTIYRWWQSYRKGGLPALVTKDRADKGTSKSLNPAAMEMLIAMAAGHWSLAEMYRAYGEERDWREKHVGRPMGDFEYGKYARHIDEDGKLRESARLPEISRETYRRWFERVPEFIRELARNGKDGFKNTQEPISFRDITSLQPMDYVVMDHRVLDVFCLTGGDAGKPWRLVRPWLTAAIDMRTRKWLSWVVVESPSSDSIAAVLRKLFVGFGVPRGLYWDNGKDFTCQWLEGRDAKSRTSPAVGELDTTWRGVLGTLDVRVTHAIPYNARAKIIEPNFGRISKFDMSLPEWCGHKPGARPERFDVMVRTHEEWTRGSGTGPAFRTIGEIAALYSDLLEDLNEREFEAGAEGMRKVRAGGGYAWMSPNECWDVLIPRVERRTVSADVLHLAFNKRREITVQHAEIGVTFAGQRYHYRMENSIELARLNGKVVELAYDPLDLETGAVYYEGRCFGIVHCIQLRKMGEDGFREDERDRRRLLRETRKFLEAAHGLAPVADATERLARRREVRPIRAEAVQVTVPAELPAAIVAEAQARKPVAVETVELVAIEPPAAPDKGDDEFHFFRG